METRAGERRRTLLRAAMVLGLALLLAGFMVRDVRARAFVETDYIARALWAAGGLLAAGSLALDWRRVLALLRGRRTAEGVNFVFVAVLGVVLAALLCYITTRRYARLDWTRAGRFGLHSQTESILAALEQDVHVVTLYRSDDSYDMAVVGYAGDMLEEMKARSPHISTEEMDLTLAATQSRINRLLAQLGVSDLAVPAVVFVAGDRHETITFDRIATSSRGSVEMPDVFLGEDAFAGALKRLTAGEGAVVYALTGHGQRQLKVEDRAGGPPQAAGAGAGPARSLSRVASALEHDNYEVRVLDLAAEGRVPEDCDVLVVAGARARLAESELRAISRYLDEQEGSLILMLESPFGVAVDTNVTELLADYGIRAREDAVGVTRMQGLLGQTVTEKTVPVPGERLPDHPAVAGLDGFRLWLEMAVPLEITAEQPAPGLSTRPLLTGVESSWGATGIEPGSQQAIEYNPAADLPPGVIVGAVVEPTAGGGMAQEAPEGPKILVLGSTGAFANTTVDQHRANLYLLSNAVNWMAGRTHLLGIPPRSMDMHIVSVSPSQVLAARYVFIGVLPALFIAAGALVWLVRRR